MDIDNEVQKYVDILADDPDITALTEPFKNSGNTFQLDQKTQIGDIEYSTVFTGTIIGTVKFIYRLLGYVSSSKLDKLVIANTKFFYLMAIAANLIKHELIEKKQLKYHGKNLYFRNDLKMIYLQVAITKQNVTFIFRLRTADLDDAAIDLRISRYFSSELNYDSGVIVSVHQLDRCAEVAVKVTEIDKNLINKLLDRL